jgi:hypothetical protein
MARMSFASQLGAGKIAGLQVPWNDTLPLEPDPERLVAQLGVRLLGAGGDSPTVRLIRDELKELTEPAQRRAAAVALFVGSPEFQRQ